jgi:hypothetical protein
MAGYVGSGMLAAAVCGEVFASPSEDAVLAAIRATTGEAGRRPRSHPARGLKPFNLPYCLPTCKHFSAPSVMKLMLVI